MKIHSPILFIYVKLIFLTLFLIFIDSSLYEYNSQKLFYKLITSVSYIISSFYFVINGANMHGFYIKSENYLFFFF